MQIKTDHCRETFSRNIALGDSDSKIPACKSGVLIVADLVVCGTQCTSSRYIQRRQKVSDVC